MSLTKLLSSLILSFFVMCFSTSATSAQETAKPIPTRRATIRGESFAYKLSDRDFANTPSWNQEEGEPPISISRAVKIARENLPRFVKNADVWKIRQVTLQSMSEDKWYYRINFFCSGIQCREIEERSFMAIVKMDGTIVEPKKVTIED